MPLKEIDSLIRLLDDPDVEIAEQVEDRLLFHGNKALEQLEEAWSHSFDSLLQERLENVIHKIQFNEVKHELEIWAMNDAQDLLQGALIVNKYQYPDLDPQIISNKIDEIRREIWLRLFNDMSSIEKITLVNYVFYKEFGFSGNTTNHQDPENSYIGKVLERKKGNQISLAIIYSIIAQKLDLPVYGVNLPQHFVLAYIDETRDPGMQVQFYINAFNKGYTFGRKDITSFLKQLKLDEHPVYYEPCSNKDIIKRVLRNLTSSYQKAGQEDKVREMGLLLEILNRN